MPHRLVYFSNTDMRSGRVTAIQILNTCLGFTQSGWQVDLWDYFYFSRRSFSGHQHYLDEFNIPARVHWRTFPSILFHGAEKIPGLVGVMKTPALMVFTAALWLRQNFTCEDIFYARCYSSLGFMQRLRRYLPEIKRPKIFFEAHELPPPGPRRNLLKTADGIISISAALKEQIMQTMNIPGERILVAYDAVDLEKFYPQDHGFLPTDSPKGRSSSSEVIALYAGGFYAGELNYLGEISKYLPANFTLLALGGTDREVREYQERYRGLPIRFLEAVPHRYVPSFLQSADILLMPYTGNLRWSGYFSPVKMFEYMAVRRPIISSDLPVLREVLIPEVNACLVPINQPQIFAREIVSLANSPLRRKTLVDNAYQTVQSHTWDQRAKSILDFCSSMDRNL